MDRYILALAFLSAIIVAAAAQSRCPLTYEPVVDTKTGIPFYNDCLARRQLGEAAVLISHQEALQAAATADKARRLSETTDDALSTPAAHDYMRLVPPPADSADIGDDGAVGSATISRFAQEGFFFVGRPGFLDGQPAARSSQADKDPAMPTSMDGSRVSLRVTYPEGDMYMKIWSGRELREMVAAQTSAEADALGLNLPSAPDGTDPTLTDSADDVPPVVQAPNGRRSRRMLNNGNGQDNGQGNGQDNGQDNGQGNGPRVLAGLIRTEVLKIGYPSSTATYITQTQTDTSRWCSGALIGSTGRLILTAAHCLYNYDQATREGKGYYPGFFTAPGQYRLNNSATLLLPYSRSGSGVAEVLVNWMSKGSFEADIGLLRLNYHVTAPGTLGFDYKCPNVTTATYMMTSAGYPADAPVVGSLWRQRFAVATGVCNAEQNINKDNVLEKNLGYAFVPGQNGSAIWTDDNVARYVMTGSTPPAAAAITAATYSWIMDYTTKNILTLPKQVLMTGPATARKFITCDTSTMQCVGTASKAAATAFFPYPIKIAMRFAFQVPNTTLCLTAAADGTVSLVSCNTNNRFTFTNGALWALGAAVDAKAPSALKSLLNNWVLKYNGDGQPVTISATSLCTVPMDCTWYKSI